MENNNYKIDIPHFYCLEYIEGEKKIILDIDFRDPVRYLNKSLIEKWEPPYDNDIICGAEKERIINNIYNYLVNKRGFNDVVLEHETET